MIAKEQHKLEVLKRRQEREIQQMLQYEITRQQLLDKQQKKIDALEVGFRWGQGQGFCWGPKPTWHVSSGCLPDCMEKAWQYAHAYAWWGLRDDQGGAVSTCVSCARAYVPTWTPLIV